MDASVLYTSIPFLYTFLEFISFKCRHVLAYLLEFNVLNAGIFYYNQVILGKNINEAVLFLKDDASENRNIKSDLEREVKE